MRGVNLKYFILGALLATGGLYVAAVSIPNTFSPGTPIKSSEVNANFAALKTAVDALQAGSGATWSLTGNAGTDPATNYLGTTNNVALEIKVNGGRAMRIEPASTGYGFIPNLIGGFAGNNVTPGAGAAMIGGGGGSANPNRVTDNFGTVGGGLGNRAGDNAGTISDHESATVAGGYVNAASGGASFIGGGGGNTASGDRSTVGGGFQNNASGPMTTIAGGYQNVASANAATVPGGANNTASERYSFAAGAAASATHPGSFVWASFEPASSWGDNTFTVRSPGGARFYTASGTGTGVQLSAGGTAWASISDRNAKEHFAVVDSERLLETLDAMPVQTWNLRAQPSSLRHIGPVAQDFNSGFAYLFGHVESPTYINSMDAVGVSLAGVQGLYRTVKDQQAEIAALKAQNARLEREVSRLHALEVRLERLEQTVLKH